MKTLLIPLLLILFASCDPCKRLAKDKYKPCFEQIKPEVTTPEIKDSFNIQLKILDSTVYNIVDSILYTDTCLTLERKREISKAIKDNISNFIEASDTTISTKEYSLSISQNKGVISYDITLHPQDCDCPTQYIYKEQFNWKWLAGFGFLAAIIILIYRRKA